jgi:hypothetical protein
MSNKTIYQGVEANPLASDSTETKTPVSNAVVNHSDENTALKAEVEKLKAENEKLANNQKAKVSKNKMPYNKVTERFRTTFGSQVIKSVDAKKAVFEKALSKTNGITREEFHKEFRDCVFDRMLVNIKFVSECIELKVNPFEAVQFIVMSGNPTVELVLKHGVGHVYKDSLELLKGEIFTEKELAVAKFSTVTLTPTDLQCTEAQRLINAVSQVLDIMKKAA